MLIQLLLNKGLQPLVAFWATTQGRPYKISRFSGRMLIRPYILLFISFVFISCSGCNSTPSTQADTDVVVDDATDDSDSTDFDTIAESDEVPDGDADVLCPPHKDAGYPYYRKDGSLHFCRECDTPTQNDPDCVANLWIDANQKMCTEYPDKDCCGYPCTMDALEPFFYQERDGYYLDQCDIMINPKNPWGWQTGIVTFKHYNLSDGKIGFTMDHAAINALKYATDKKSVEFDIKARSYKIVSTNSDNMTVAYHKGAFLTVVWDTGLKEETEPHNGYLLYSSPSGVMQVAYNKPVDFITYQPAVNEKWVFANIRETKGGVTEMKYAKIGSTDVWQWQTLGVGVGYTPQLLGDKLAVYTDDFNGYLCDLSSSPKSLNDCIKVNRDGEEIRHPQMDRENPQLVYFNPVELVDGFMQLDLSKTPPSYTEIKLDGLMEPRFSVAVNQVRGNMILYADIFITDMNSGSRDIRLCYYRLDEKKSYCSLATPHADDVMKFNQSVGEFEGHWLVWQDSVAPMMKLRDMECYCDHHPELCPFDDYTPNPENPKEVKPL